MRFRAASTLSSIFSNIPDKKKAWDALLRLTSDEEAVVRLTAAQALSSALNSLPDKQQAWDDLHRLTNDRDSVVRSRAAYALGSAFFQIPDKQQAWEDLHRLTKDEDWRGRAWAASAIGLSFVHIPDKHNAWNDLHRLTSDEHSSVKSSVASEIGSLSHYLLDKEQVWNDLHRLTNDQDADVRRKATYSLGFVFSNVADNQKVWNSLQILINDEDKWVRAYANFVLGKVSIFNASLAVNEDNYKDKLEQAIDFFEKASQESPNKELNPAQFCLPFYRSFHTIIFRRQKAKDEVGEYLLEAKNAVKGSESKELLLKAVENLGNALNEVQKLENLDLHAMKDELNFYRKYCDSAAELLRDTEEKAPIATIVIQKGLPILDRNLKELLEEIQKKAKTACTKSKGTLIHEIAYAVNVEVQKWEISNQEEMTQNVEGLIEIFRLKMPHQPGYDHIFKEIEGIRDEKDLIKQYKIISRLIGLIPMFSLIPEQVVQDIKEIKDNTIDIKVELDTIGKKLDCIRYDIFKIKLNSDDVISKLIAMKNELEKINEIMSLNTFSIDKLNSTQVIKLDNLNNDLSERLNEMEILIDSVPKNEETSIILDRLNKLHQSGLDILLQRSSGIATLISFIVLLAQLYQQYGPI